jgi:hypothetical protein
MSVASSGTNVTATTTLAMGLHADLLAMGGGTS